MRRHARAAARPVYHRVLGPLPVDPTRPWRGTATAGEPMLRLACYTDCSVRAMNLSHTVASPVGWPAALAERLSDRGIGLECSLVVAGSYHDLGTDEFRTRHLRLSGAPDVVVVQTGGIYGRRVILPDTPASLRLRDDVGRRLGRLVFAGYRAIRPVVALAGRPVAPYPGPAQLRQFLATPRAAWPHAAILVIAPSRRSTARAEQRRLEARVVADARLAAEATGTDFMDVSDLLGTVEERLRCANGFNLNEAGSRLVAAHLLAWLDARAPAGQRWSSQRCG